MASIFNLYVEQGSDFLESLDITGDYTGYEIRGNIVDSIGETTVNIVAWTSDTDGRFDISMTNTETASMSAGIGKYDIEIVDTLGKVTRVLQGRVYVNGEVTI